jgi:sterol desaturase/sphingolipid hydroxylase (fatty acid hydroxylase superfamily)
MAIAILFGGSLLLLILERFANLRFRCSPMMRPFLSSDVIYLITGYLLLAQISKTYIADASGWIGKYLILPRLSEVDLPIWIAMPIALLALDLGNYIAHLMLHRFDLLWEFHKVHHSSPTLDWLATFRSHIIEQALRRLIAPVILILIGFPIGAVVLAGAVFTFWAMLNHSNLNINLGILEDMLITPRQHRVHHVQETSNWNLGTVFTFWDRLRGTFIRKNVNIDSKFGVPGEVDTYPQGWLLQLIEPFRRCLSRLSMPAGLKEKGIK